MVIGISAALAEAVADTAVLAEAAEAAEAMEAVEVAESLETKEEIIGESGLTSQLEVIQNKPLRALEAQNETLLKTRNWELAGQVHPETSVPFVKETVRLSDGTLREGVFPEFSIKYETKLPDNLLQASDYQQMRYCTEQLREAVASEGSLKESFSETQLEQIHDGETPDGFTWHHHQETGRMQLVESSVHLRTGHTGGKEIWGGGR